MAVKHTEARLTTLILALKIQKQDCYKFEVSLVIQKNAATRAVQQNNNNEKDLAAI